MADYRATVTWTLEDGGEFLKGRYSRGHSIVFDGGHAAPGTASHHVVGKKWAVEGAVDPEQMLVASLSTCHMLTFLHLAAKAGHRVDHYDDTAEGVLAKTDGRVWVSLVTLRPRVVWTGTRAEELALHHAAHDECFIANSVKTDVRCEPA